MLEISNVGILAAFAAGAISFLSPCVLPLVPGYVSYIAGRSVAVQAGGGAAVAERLPAVGLSLCFVLGFSTVFVLLGASATALGQLLLAYHYELSIIGGAIVIGFGLFMLGMVRLSWLQRDVRFHGALEGGRPIGAYVLGLAFAFGWTPCIGPVLGAILTVSATSVSVADGITLLAIYSAGLGVPFLLAAAFTDRLVGRVKAFSRIGRGLQIVAGLVMIAMGVAMMTGHLVTFAFWMLEQFPILGRIG